MMARLIDYFKDKQGSVKPIELIDRFTGKLGISQKHAQEMKLLLSNDSCPFAKSQQRPATVAGGIIAQFCRSNNLQIPVSKIAKVTGTSQVTLYRFLNKYIHASF